MMPQQQQVENKFSKQVLQNNKNQMFKILKSAPIAGVYLGEDPSNWPIFFQFYLDFLKAQIGPRGQCSKAVRQSMRENPQFYDELLSLLKMTHKSHIRDIYVKYKMYSPCKQYDDLLKLEQHIEKNEDSYNKLMDENSVMYVKIKQGMISKRGQEYDYKSEIDTIRQNYKNKLDNLRKTAQQLQQKVNASQNFARYVKLKEGMNKYFKMWKEADVRVGHESIEKGDTFEKIVRTHLLPTLLSRSKIGEKEQIKIESNCRWHPKSLGQIDIAILVYNEGEQKWIAKTLIQCKSRLFDIRQAYNQVAVLKQKGKQKLCTSLGILDIANNFTHFIVTTLPENPFHLPIQSKMKQALEKAGKNIPVDELKQELLYPFVKQCFKDLQSPLQWFLENDADNLIVLNY